MLCKIIIYIFFKDYIIENYYKSYISFCNQVIVINHKPQNACCFYIKNIRNSTNYHQYNQSNRSSYRDSVYTVKPGDTLFYIAWLTGNNYLDLAKNNGIEDVNVLYIDQVLQVKSNNISLFFKKILKKMRLPFYDSHHKIKKLFNLNKNRIILYTKEYVLCNRNKVNYITSCLKKTNTIALNTWNWPTYGSIINTFSDTEGGNTGIDISGVFDQPILATTNGQVVYVGNVLKGYGNLVIIKHENDYLSAYAHNNKILVTERQKVKIGDQIATMGNSGTHEIKLHFEIRYQGKSINPLYLLP